MQLCMLVDWRNLKMVLEIDKPATAMMPSLLVYKQNHDEHHHIIDLEMVEVMRVQNGVGLCVTGGVDRENLDAYEGSFQNGKREGKGVWHGEFGLYTGEFKSDQICGEGVLELSSGDIITGCFSNRDDDNKAMIEANPYIQGEPDGDVVINFADGSYYKGKMQQGRITGIGEYYSMTERYVGELENGRYHGQGVWTSADGNIAREGLWKEGYLHGSGCQTVRDQNESFTGHYNLGAKKGKGIDSDDDFHRIGFYTNGQNYQFAETCCGKNKSFTHEGVWLGGRACAGGMITSKKMKKKEAWPAASGDKYLKRNEPLAEILQKKQYSLNHMNKTKIESYAINKSITRRQIRKNLNRYQLALRGQYVDMLPPSTTNT